MLMTRFSFFDCIVKPSKLSVFALISDEGKREKGIGGTGNQIFS